jgi:hypothetical protein
MQSARRYIGGRRDLHTSITPYVIMGGVHLKGVAERARGPQPIDS